jgi:hypothetical protein
LYEGQIVAEHCRPDDVVVNPTKAKPLTNMRTTSSDENIILKPARQDDAWSRRWNTSRKMSWSKRRRRTFASQAQVDGKRCSLQRRQ